MKIVMCAVLMVSSGVTIATAQSAVEQLRSSVGLETAASVVVPEPAIQSQNAKAGEYIPVEDLYALQMTGFSVIKRAADALTLKHHSGTVFTISKARFKNQNSARKFCAYHNSRLDNDFGALLFAMSGAATVNKFIDNSISFKFNTRNGKTSGIWFWSGKGNNMVTLMYDGRGTASEEVDATQMSQALRVATRNPHFEINLPAICSNKR